MHVAGAVVAAVLTITTQNVRIGIGAEHVAHDIDQAAQSSSVVITQEMGYRNASRYEPPGWASTHRAGVRRGDCATYWDTSKWSARRSFVTRLTNAPFKAGLRYALTTVLAGRNAVVAVVCLHLITRSTEPGRRHVYARGIARLRALLDRLDDIYRYVVVGGDWNRNWAQRAPIPGYDTREPPRRTGVHGGRIDYFWWRHTSIRPRSIVVIGHTFSDHNGVRMRLALRR